VDRFGLGRALRRAIGGLLVAVLLVTALAFYTYSPYLSLTAGAGGPVTSAVPTGSSSVPSTASVTTSTTPSPSPTVGAADRDLPPGPGGQEPGVLLLAVVRPDRVFEVTETVRLAAPVSWVTLTPPDLRRGSKYLQSARPEATDVVLRGAEQRAVRPPGGRVVKATTVALNQPTDRFEIRYRLHGSIRMSRPSTAGRALGAVAPLTSRLPAEMPVAVRVYGTAVQNLDCVGLPTDQRACFDGKRPHARVNQHLPYRAAVVQVQLDLQAAGDEGRR
jgi:hypothetical protein